MTLVIAVFLILVVGWILNIGMLVYLSKKSKKESWSDATAISVACAFALIPYLLFGGILFAAIVERIKK